MSVHIGDRAITRTQLRPTGRVEIDGQLYDARSERDFIEPNVTCVVLRGEFRNVIVRPLLNDNVSSELPNMGEVLPGHIFERTASEVAEAHHRFENERMAPWQRWLAGSIAAISLGGAFGIGSATMAWLLGKLGEHGSDPTHVALILGGTTLVGIGWALCLFMVQYVILPIVSMRPSFIVVFCGMVGCVVGAWPSSVVSRWQELAISGLIGTGIMFAVGFIIAAVVQRFMNR